MVKQISFILTFYKSASLKGNSIVTSFDHVGSGLEFTNGSSTNFEIAGSDDIFHPASIKIENDQLVVSSTQESNPQQVGYAWKNWVVGDFFNKGGLPSPSFSTGEIEIPYVLSAATSSISEELETKCLSFEV